MLRVNVAVIWDRAPAKARFEFVHARFLSGGLFQGWGDFSSETLRLSLTSAGELCHLCFAVDVDVTTGTDHPPLLKVVDTPQPFSVSLWEVLRSADRSVRLKAPGVTVRAEMDAWAMLAAADASSSKASDNAAGPNPSTQNTPLPLYRKFTPEQIKQFGPIREREELETKRRVYTSPFMYPNVEVGDFYEIDSSKGIEFKADTGFLTVCEDQPIMAVTVVGSGCTPKGYNICEWWGEGETIDNLKDQLVKRQRVDNLNGTHPSIWIKVLQGLTHGLTYRDFAPGEMDGPVDALKKLSDRYYEGLYLGFYENTVYFRVGPPYPKKATVRCGCKVPEDPGTRMERYPGDYAIRLVETTVIV